MASSPAGLPAATWADHLRAGGVEPWARWRDRADGAERAASSPGRRLPGAQQLELLRRVNLAGPTSSALADRVLAARSPGRGPQDLDLVGATPEPPRFGSPPVDPEHLPAAELVRLAVGLVADDVVAAGAPPAPAPGRRRPWARGRVVDGDPWLAWSTRAELGRRAGRGPGGRRPTHLLVGTDVSSMLVHAWTAQCLGAGAQPWPRWIGTRAGRPVLPAALDLARAAEQTTRRVGRRRVVVDLAPDGSAPTPSADAAELARLVGALLGGLVPAEQRRPLLRETLLPRLLEHPGPALVVPVRHQPWAAARAVEMRDRMRAGGYRVVGGPDRLLPPAAASVGVETPDDGRVLALAVALLRAGTPTRG